jgi:hypothetical protein
MQSAADEVRRLCDGGSDYLRAVSDAHARANAALNNSRPLNASEIEVLKANGCWSAEWSGVKVLGSTTPERIHRCTFQGTVVLGPFKGTVPLEAGVELPTGLYGSTIVDCIITDNALVHDTSLLARCLLGARAVVMGCGTVMCTGNTSYGNGIELPVGVEVGACADVFREQNRI